MFADRGIAPVAWTALAFVAGVTAGILIRRTVPAMAVVLAVLVTLQILWPGLVRPHLISPQRVTVPVAVSALSDALMTHSETMIMPTNQGLPVSLPGAWIVANQTITPAGSVFVLPRVPACQSSSLGAASCDDWLAAQHLRQVVSYLPGGDFWPLQWYETSILLAVTVGLGSLCTWQVRRLLT